MSRHTIAHPVLPHYLARLRAILTAMGCTGGDLEALMSKGRAAKTLRARALCVWVLYHWHGVAGMSHVEIGVVLNSNSTTVSHMRRRVEDDPALLAEARALLEKCA